LHFCDNITKRLKLKFVSNMKKTSILLTLFCGLLYVSLSSNNAGPAQAGTGDRTALGCGGSGCHSGSGTFDATGVLLLDAAGTTTLTSYTPGTNYRVLLAGYSMTGGLPSKFGFQVKAVSGTGTTTAGTFNPIPATTHTITAGGVVLCEHSMALPGTPLVDSISIPWKAPSAGTGTVTLKAALNAVNGDGSTSGDFGNAIFSAPITEATSTAPPITGTFTVCVGASSTLANATAGGSWTSGTTGVATIGSMTGIMTGVAGGTSTITYVSTSGTSTQVVTVVATPTAAIAGAASVCVAHNITLTGTPAGGTWTSVFPAKATVSAAGVVTGVATGVDTIKYQATNACGTNTAKKVLTITPNSSTCGLPVNATTITTEELFIYPNPNRGSFTLDLASPFNGQAYVVVTNATGAKVKEFTVQANNKIDVVLNQPPGVYFVAATTLTQRYFVKVVVE
jgi:hypothetical protein